MAFAERIRELNELIEGKIGKLNMPQRMGLYFDFGCERFLKRTSMMDYFQYGFYELSRAGRSKYATFGRMEKFNEVSNDKKLARTFKDKAAFVEKFENFLGRDVLDMRKTTLQEFLDFTAKHDQLFIKPIEGLYGIGAEKRACKDQDEAKRLYDEYSKKEVIIEEVVHQHPAFAEFNDTSLNSLRVVTYVRANGKPCVMAGAVIRIGRKGKIADNFHHGGIGAQVNIETGYVTSTGIDKAGNRYVTHPDSGKPIVGFKVPLWDEIREKVLEAALVIPEVRYVGWDVAVTDDGRILLIEGNDHADPDLGQMSDRIGKWPEFEQYMNEVQNLKNPKGDRAS